MRRSERGSATPFVVLAMVTAGVLALQVGRLGGAAAARAKAQTAADASALAGAADGREAARALAEANGARLAEYEELGSDTRVVVQLGPAQARGRARRAGWTGGLGGGGASRNGLAPAMVAALARAEQLLGRPVPITSGFRSAAAQQALWANRAANPFPVAAPGTSMHERGLAVDVPLSFVPELTRVAPEVGLCHPFPKADPVHFEVCR
jgi:hypothetical protein